MRDDELDAYLWHGMPETLSDVQLARLLDAKPAQVRALVSDGLPAERIGRLTVFPTVPALRWCLQRSGSWRDRQHLRP